MSKTTQIEPLLIKKIKIKSQLIIVFNFFFVRKCLVLQFYYTITIYIFSIFYLYWFLASKWKTWFFGFNVTHLLIDRCCYFFHITKVVSSWVNIRPIRHSKFIQTKICGGYTDELQYEQNVLNLQNKFALIYFYLLIKTIVDRKY